MENSPELEAHIAHLERAVEDLSDVVARQDADIARLQRQVAALIDREAAREAASPQDGRPPPHW